MGGDWIAMLRRRTRQRDDPANIIPSWGDPSRRQWRRGEQRAGEDEGADGSCRENAGNRQRGMRMLMQMQRLGQAARLRGFSAREREEEEEEEEGGEGEGGGGGRRPKSEAWVRFRGAMQVQPHSLAVAAAVVMAVVMAVEGQ